ncbi:MAG: acetamidase/formamidase family protein [Cyclobacteriaceae bacterium]|nr:acetamidase/formamidase family protein [Cyclobacteriaceae bacterium]
MKRIFMAALVVLCCQCQNPQPTPESSQEVVAAPAPESPEPQFTLTSEQTHNKFSSTIEPVVTVPSGAIVEAFTEEATDRQLKLNSPIEDLENVSFDPVHPLTGPVFVEGAQPGDMLAVTLHEIEIGSWGWTAVIPGFGFLADRFDQYVLKTYDLEHNNKVLDFNDQVKIPLKPFPGVMGVAPATDSLLNTIPPRANGGNMDNPFLTKGTTVYFPVLVEGGLFSIGDAHAVQGLGEVCGTAVEAPMRIVYEIELIKGRTIPEPQYETADYYAVTAFGTTLDIAAKKATEFMVDHLVHQRNLTEEEAYMLCSLAGDLHIAEVVDLPHVLVAMHIPKNIFK